MIIADFPQRPGLRQVLLEVSGVRARLGGSVRAALAVAVPSFIGLAAGFGATAALSALGAFAVVYGERRPFRTWWKAIIGYGLAFILCAAVGTLVGRDGWPIILMMTAVVVAAATWVDALREGAPGSFLLLLCAELACILVVDDTASAAAVIGWTTIGARAALLVGMAPVLWDREGPQRAAVARARSAVDALADRPRSDLLRRRAIHEVHAAWDCLGQASAGRDESLMRTHRRLLAVIAFADNGPIDAGLSGEQLELAPMPQPGVTERLRWGLRFPRTAILATRLAVACVAAGALALTVDLGRPDWAVISAAMILHQGPDRLTGSWRALHRCVGALIGVGLVAVVAALLDSPIWLIVLVILLMAGTEIFLVVNYALAMVFITPLALALGELRGPESVTEAITDRFFETLIGVGVAVVVLWCVAPRAYRRTLLDSERRVVKSIREVGVEDDARRRRRLEFELDAATTALVAAGISDPEWPAANGRAITDSPAGLCVTDRGCRLRRDHPRRGWRQQRMTQAATARGVAHPEGSVGRGRYSHRYV